MAECKPRMTYKCDTSLTDGTDKDKESGTVPVWSICLPFGGRLYSEGGHVNHEPGTPPPNGTYSQIVIVDGCITEAKLADIPTYTPTPCASVPPPCDGDGANMPDPSPTVGNMFTYDASGRPLVRLSVQSGNGISVTGNGTPSSPLVITNTQAAGSATVVQAGNSEIIVTGAGTSANPYRISHATNMGGTYGPYVFDDYGHLIDHNPQGGAMYVTGVIGGDGVNVSQDANTGIATVSLATPSTEITGIRRLGGWDVQFFRNRVINVTQAIDFPEGTYRFRGRTADYDITFNDYGSATALQTLPIPPDHRAFSKYFANAVDAAARSITFTTPIAASFRIQYRGPIDNTSAPYLRIDGSNITGNSTMTGNSYDALPPAIYGAGTHTVEIDPAVNFTASGILDVILVEIDT